MLHSTSLALIDCSNNWFINIDHGGITSTVLFDIKNAFDTIDHEILQQKLEYYGVEDEELSFLKSYLTNKKQCCNMNNQTSSFKIIKSFFPQGSILGPLLFKIFINDLPNCIENGHITMYADDTSSSTRVNDMKDIETKVIPDLIKICDWLKANKLSLNALKTELMFLGSTRTLAIRTDSHLIRRVYKSRYLRLLMTSYL